MPETTAPLLDFLARHPEAPEHVRRTILAASRYQIHAMTEQERRQYEYLLGQQRQGDRPRPPS